MTRSSKPNTTRSLRTARRCETCAPGYDWRMPAKTREEFTADGFFRTGNLGQYDADGYLSIVGHSKDLVISGGYNVYPKEVEMLLDELPGVAELPRNAMGKVQKNVLRDNFKRA